METQRTINKRIGWMMRDAYAEACREPLPERWVDLIKYLNDKERGERPTPPPPSTRSH